MRNTRRKLILAILGIAFVLFSLYPAGVRVQACVVQVNVASGFGASCVSLDTYYTYQSDLNPGEAGVFDQTVYLQFLTDPYTCLNIVVQSQTGWTAGSSTHLNYLSWDCANSPTGDLIGTDPKFHRGTIENVKQFMWASPTPFTITIRFHVPGDPEPENTAQAGDQPPQVPPPALADLANCPLLGAATSTFANLPGAWALSGSATNPEGTARGLYLQNGSPKLTMNLSPNKQYTIEIKARNGSGNQNGFRVGLGRQSYNPIPIDPGGSVDIKLGPANYNAGAPDDSIYETSPEETPAGYFTLSFRRNGLLDGQTNDYVVIDYVCVRDAGVEGAIGQANTDDTSFLGQATPQECKTEPNKPQTEPYSATGNQLTDMYANFKGLINDWGSYMSQLMARLTSCILKPGLKGVWQWIQGVLNFIMRARDWIDIFFKNFGDYLGLAAKWLAGFIVNVISILLNLIAQLLNNLGLSRIVNDVLHFLNAILPKGLASIPEIVGTVWDAFSNFVNFVATVIVGFIQGVFNLISMLFGVTRAVINADPIPLPIPGFCDTTASSIPENCIWVFTVDYTILDPNSPIGAFIPLLKGGAGIGLIWWALHAIRSSTMEQATSEA